MPGKWSNGAHLDFSQISFRRKRHHPTKPKAMLAVFAMLLAIPLCLTGCASPHPLSGTWYQDTDEGVKTLTVPDHSGGTWKMADQSASSPYSGLVALDSESVATFSLEPINNGNGDTETMTVTDQANGAMQGIKQGRHVVMSFDGTYLEGYYDDPSKTCVLDGVWHR